ncbi:hypothetical protein PFISCL1PPCAC_28385, partial [Pristionchus fissidentatus]
CPNSMTCLKTVDIVQKTFTKSCGVANCTNAALTQNQPANCYKQHSYADLLLLRGQMQFDLDFVRLYGNTHGDCCFLPQPELIEYPLSYCKWRPAHKHTRTHTSADFSNPPSIKNLRILVFYTEHRSKQTLTILNYSAITTSFRLYPLRFKIPRKYGEPCDPHPSFNYATVYIIYATILYSSNLPIK